MQLKYQRVLIFTTVTEDVLYCYYLRTTRTSRRVSLRVRFQLTNA